MERRWEAMSALAHAAEAAGIGFVGGVTGVAYAIRQVHIAIGCQHACSHCFSAAPRRGQQMQLDGFARLARELGDVAASTGKPYSFLFLGSATDPSSVEGYARYQDVWIDAMPAMSPVRIYTHGWVLVQSKQQTEFREFLVSLLRSREKIESINLSVDEFSEFARSDWQAYLRNIKANLRGLTSVLRPDQIIIEALYAPARLVAPPEATLEHWRNRLDGAADPTEVERDMRATLEALRNRGKHGATARLTLAVMELGDFLGWPLTTTLHRSRDDGTPMAFGRGARLLRDLPAEAKARGLEAHRKKSWKRLEPLGDLHGGIQIYPDGRARLLSYDGYVQGAWLNGREKVIPYL